MEDSLEFMKDALQLMIPLLAILLGVGLAYWSVYWKHQKNKLQYEERRLMIERGMTPPPDLPTEEKRVTPEDCLRRGTIMVFLGLGLGIGSFIMSTAQRGGPPPWLFGVAGAIVGLLGLGNLMYYVIVRRRDSEALVRPVS